MENIKEVKQISVKGYYVIIVVGAGIAGVSVALSAGDPKFQDVANYTLH